MKIFMTVFLAFALYYGTGQARDFETLSHLRSKVIPSVQAKTVQDLIERVIGERSHEFNVVVDPSLGPKNRDTFNLVTTGSVVSITGSTGVGAAMGFYYYLKYYCGGQFTWAGQQTNLPAKLPQISAPGITKSTNDQFRYFQNVCTVSYSFAWYDWPRWERMIDWMAMQGINLPLAFTGQEAIFQIVFDSMGFNDSDICKRFGGPAFLAWTRMGNIRNMAGPLPQSWIDQHLVIQSKILQRMRSLGMIPALPGFAGHVPESITKLYPKANVTRLGTWAGFSPEYSATYLLDFKDPLFKIIGSKFIKQMESVFGVDHVYNADSFNEMEPRQGDPAYLSAASKAVFEAMTAGDPQAIWLMQGWLFTDIHFWDATRIKALLTGVPQGKMVILDLYSELEAIYTYTQSYYGQPFIWCMLHDFGGKNELYGALDLINVGPFNGRKFPNSTMVGTGITPEGIFQNEVMYEFMNENAWRTEPRNISQWITEFQAQRYGGSNSYTITAWDLLKRSVYNCTDGHHESCFDVTITTRPRLNLSPDVWFDPELLYQAWDNLTKIASALKDKELFRYDVVDVTRNSLQFLSLKYYHGLVLAYKANDSAALQKVGSQLTELFTDIDTLLASNENFLLGKWIAAAKAHGVTASEIKLYEYNARNQVTLWGPDGQIHDYAAKQWSGLIKDFYIPRWQLFIQTLMNSIKNKTPFDAGKFNSECLEKVEKPWNVQTNIYPDNPIGDSIEIVNKMHQKYRPETRSGFFRDLHIQSAKEKKLGVKRAGAWAAKEWSRPVFNFIH